MVSEVGEKESTWNVSPWKFEAGTPPFLEVLAFESVIDFFETKLDLKQAEEWESQLKEYFLTQLNKRQNIQIFHPPRGESSGIVSFLHRNIHPQDLMSFLDRNGFCLRVGHHCAQPLHKNLNIEGSMRVSFAFYNTISEIDQFFEAFDEAIDFFSGREKGQSSLGFTEKDILKAIAVVEDPELMVPLVDLGLVYGVSIDEGRNVHVDMTLTSPGCPLAQQIVLNVEDSVRSLSGFEDVKVNLVWEPKWDPKKMASEEAKEILGIW